MAARMNKKKTRARRRHLAVGRDGEELVVGYLEEAGYAILARNYRQPFGEIDIIAEQGETLVFVEVKTRTSGRYGSPLEAVNLRKRQRMTRAALDYMVRNGRSDQAARFDVVAVSLDQGGEEGLEHIKNAFDTV